jgi:hypothetical protein
MQRSFFGVVAGVGWGWGGDGGKTDIFFAKHAQRMLIHENDYHFSNKTDKQSEKVGLF